MHKSFIRKLNGLLAIVLVLLLIVILLDNAAKAMFPVKYGEHVFKYSREYSIDPYLVFAVIKAESSFNPKAVSKKDARGLMQITGGTGSWVAQKLKIKAFTPERLYEPELNIRLGCWYIRWLTDQFEDNTDLVIAAYNGGHGKVNEWLRDKNYSSSGKSLEKIPFKETDKFLKRVKNNWHIYKKLYERRF